MESMLVTCIALGSHEAIQSGTKKFMSSERTCGLREANNMINYLRDLPKPWIVWLGCAWTEGTKSFAVNCFPRTLRQICMESLSFSKRLVHR